MTNKSSYVKASMLYASYKPSWVGNLFREISGVYYFWNQAVHVVE